MRSLHESAAKETAEALIKLPV